MTAKKILHIAMTNSFNMLMGVVSLEELYQARIPIIVHNPHEDVDVETIDDIIEYFESIEMYENCAKLKKRYNNFFVSNNNYEECTCELPIIKRYSSVVRCDTCKKKIVM